jgi:hypothetical protein
VLVRVISSVSPTMRSASVRNAAALGLGRVMQLCRVGLNPGTCLGLLSRAKTAQQGPHRFRHSGDEALELIESGGI